MNNDIEDLLPALIALRRDLHANPEPSVPTSAATPAFTTAAATTATPPCCWEQPSNSREPAYLWLGQRGANHAAPLHHPSYDFNDDVLACGVRWFAAVAQMALH